MSDLQHVIYPTARLLAMYSVPGARFGPTPNVCYACGGRWWGLDEWANTICCGVRRTDMLRMLAADGR